MLFKVALMVALGSLWIVVLHRQRESEDEVGLKREVEAQLGALRDHLFKG
jgi:hypothetical protein